MTGLPAEIALTTKFNIKSKLSGPTDEDESTMK